MSKPEALLRIDDLMTFMDASSVNFLAIQTIRRRLEAADFERLDQSEQWHIEPGGKYYVIKNDSAIFAFVAGSGTPAEGFRIISAHSDSPGFRIKPNSEIAAPGKTLKLNTEVYGGPILYTWFDRPLSISGRVILRGESPLRPVTRFVNFCRPLLTIPHLAIHYNRSVNDGNPLSKQRDMMPVLGFLKEGMEKEGLLVKVLARALECAPGDILDFDLCLYPVEKSCLTGLDKEFISAARIDDLEMVHAGLSALLVSAKDKPRQPMTRVLAVFDNEETGSGTKQGAASPVLLSVMRRLNENLGGNEDTFQQAVANSFMVSADNGHGLHPNYESKQDPTNHPILGRGPVIKSNANCKYMTDADSSAVFRMICDKAGVPVQTFVNHSDVAGGSTLGNILTSQIELRGVDMGCPQWAMHSCRETAAVADHIYTVRAFTTFYNL